MLSVLALILLVAIGRIFTEVGNTREIRVRHTRNPPELTMREGQVYHLFLSRGPPQQKLESAPEDSCFAQVEGL